MRLNGRRLCLVPWIALLATLYGASVLWPLGASAGAPHPAAADKWSQIPNELKSLMHRTAHEVPTWDDDPYPWLRELRQWPESVNLDGTRYIKQTWVIGAQGEGGSSTTSITASFVDTTGNRRVTRGPSYSWREDSTFSGRGYEGKDWSYGRHGGLIGFCRTLKDSSLLWEWFAPDGSLTGLQLFPKVRGIDWSTRTPFPPPKQFQGGQPMEMGESNAWATEFRHAWQAYDDSLSRLETKPAKKGR